MINLPEIIVKTNAVTLHNLGYSGRGSTIAILDSGIDSTHEFFNGMEMKHFDLTGEGIQDDYKHGTHVASILCTIAPAVRILDIKILDKEGGTNVSTIMKGIDLAVKEGANIINLSVGEPYLDCPDTHPLGILVDEITASNKVIVVTAAGNLGPRRSPHVPASCLGAIAVGSCGKESRTNIWSSRGGVCGDIYPDCVAYGEEVEGAIPENDWDSISGTSQSAPQVSGMLALVKEATGMVLDRDKIEYYLANSCERTDSKEKNNRSGWGIIDMGKFLRVVQIEQEQLW